MRRWYDLVVAAEDDIATLMTVESGKPLKESKGEFTSGCACSAKRCCFRAGMSVFCLKGTAGRSSIV